MIAPPTAREDCRKLWRKVAEATSATNALMNMTGLMEGKARGIGALQMRGGNAEMKFFVQLAQGETGGGPGGGGGSPESTTTQVVSSLNPAGIGVAVHFTATVSPTVATGTIQFRIDGVNFGSPVALVSGVAVSGNTSSLTGGDHQGDAIYSGDTDYLPSTGVVTQHIVDTSSVVLTSSLNPSAPGQSVRFTAVVSPDAATGRVQFKIDGTNFGASVLLVNHRAQSNATTTLGVGDHDIEANYLGDANYGTSNDTLTQTITDIAVNSFYPYWGSEWGGNVVDIYGAGFVATPTVKFDGVNATSVTFIDSTHIRATTPARFSTPFTPGYADVVVQVINGGGHNDSICCFRYEIADEATIVIAGASSMRSGQAINQRLDAYNGADFFNGYYANYQMSVPVIGAGVVDVQINPSSLFIDNGSSQIFSVYARLTGGSSSIQIRATDNTTQAGVTYQWNKTITITP